MADRGIPRGWGVSYSNHQNDPGTSHLASHCLCFLCYEPCVCLSPLCPRTSSLSTYIYTPYFGARPRIASRPSHLTLPTRPQLRTPSRDAAAPMLFWRCHILSVRRFDSYYYAIYDSAFLASGTPSLPLPSLHYSLFVSPSTRDTVPL